MHDDVAALLPEMREYLAQTKRTEMPMSLDNWAAMVGRSYSQMRTALQHLDPVLLRAYLNHRRKHRLAVENALKKLKVYTSTYTKPIAEKYGLTQKDMRRIRARLGLAIVPPAKN